VSGREDGYDSTGREDGYADDHEDGLVGPDDGFSEDDERREVGAEGTGDLPDPEDALIARVLDQIRGSDNPDVVPAQSSVAGFAEFLAVDAVLDHRSPATAP